MKTTMILITLLILCSLASSASAFDGERKGFVLGFGLGFSPAAHSSHTNEGVTFEETASGGAGSFYLGYGWNEKNTLVFDSTFTFFTSRLYNRRETIQGFTGVSWYHYYGKKGKSFFTTLGVGMYSYDLEGIYIHIDFNPEDSEPRPQFPTDDGPGFLLGAGYEFSSHWQVGAFLSAGATQNFETDFNHAHFSVMVQGTLF
jgi:hypothetical protein